MTGGTLQRAYGHSIPVLSAAMAGVLVAGANVSRRACVLERAHRQEAVDGVQLCCLLAGALQAGESAGILGSWSCPASWFGLHEVGEAVVRPQHPGYTRLDGGRRGVYMQDSAGWRGMRRVRHLLGI